jgi:hypothetical protein
MTVDDCDDSSTLNVDESDLMIDHLSEKIENQNVSDCVEFIRSAISDNDPQVAKDIQTILTEQTPEEKQQIWDALTAEEKSTFKALIRKMSTDTPQNGVDKKGSGDDQMDRLKEAAEELIPIEKELLGIFNLEDFSDFAEWLEDPEYLKNLCLSLGDQPEKLWLAHQIQDLLNFEDKAAAVEVIVDFRKRFSKEILEAAGKLAVAVGGRRGEALRKLNELVVASKIEPGDAEIMRNIALLFWEELPTQSLMNQMFARGCPGEKYPHQTIAAWINCQEDAVRDRLLQLCRDCDRTV